MIGKNSMSPKRNEFLMTLHDYIFSRREPFFPSLAALIHQHSHMQLALPVKLNIPVLDLTDRNESQTSGKIVVDGQARTSADVFCTFFLHETGTEYIIARIL